MEARRGSHHGFGCSAQRRRTRAASVGASVGVGARSAGAIVWAGPRWGAGATRLAMEGVAVVDSGAGAGIVESAGVEGATAAGGVCAAVTAAFGATLDKCGRT